MSSSSFPAGRWRRRLATVVVAVALVAAGCSDSSDDTDVLPTSTLETTVPSGSGEATTSTAELQPLDPVAGASGVGDPYFPNAGNGGYDVGSYDLDLFYDPASGALDATAVIEATATHDLSSFNLDLFGFEVSSIELDGAAATFARREGELVITPPEPVRTGSVFTATIEYSGVPQARPGPFGAVIGWVEIPSGVYVANEPVGASTWFPVNDHPSDKASFEISVTVPDHLDSAVTGRLLDEVAGDGVVTSTFELTDPTAPYLVAVAIGDFERIEHEPVDGVMIRDYVASSVVEQASAGFARTGAMIEAFSELFGPYPFDRYGHVVVDEFLGFALENQTLSLFGKDLIGPVAEAIVAHELAHQWFGNHVSVAEWDDIWLNEGWATYAELLWQEHSGQITDIDVEAGFLLGGADLGPPPGDPGPDSMFAGSVYLRGGLTLHALRRTVGDEAFFTIAKEWVARFGGGTASTADFIALSEEISGQELDELFDAWLFAPEVPPLPS